MTLFYVRLCKKTLIYAVCDGPTELRLKCNCQTGPDFVARSENQTMSINFFTFSAFGCHRQFKYIQIMTFDLFVLEFYGPVNN